jgi:iron(III) transport system permease protein
MTGFFYATAFLVISTAMEKMDSSLEEAARIAGASPLAVLWKINLPLLRPAVLGAFMLVFLGALASYGVPALIGNPARISVVTTRIVSLQKVGSEASFQSAGLLSAALLLLSGLALLLFARAERQSEAMVRGKAVRISLVDLGRMRYTAAGLVWFFVFIVLGLPVLTIAIAACSQTQGVLTLSNFTLGHFSRVFLELDEVGRAFRNSFLLASVCATVATIFGFAIAYLAEKKKAPGGHGLIALANLPYSTPGTVLALGLIVAFSQPSFFVIPSLYNTLWLLGLAYIVKDLSYAVRTGRNSLGQIHESLDEAARICGAGRMSRWGRIWLPLLTPALAASWILIFLPAFSELTMSVLLTGPGLETVGTLLFQLQEYSDESGGGGAAVLALSLVVIALVLSIASQWLLRTGSKK